MGFFEGIQFGQKAETASVDPAEQVATPDTEHPVSSTFDRLKKVGGRIASFFSRKETVETTHNVASVQQPSPADHPLTPPKPDEMESRANVWRGRWRGIKDRFTKVENNSFVVKQEKMVNAYKTLNKNFEDGKYGEPTSEDKELNLLKSQLKNSASMIMQYEDALRPRRDHPNHAQNNHQQWQEYMRRQTALLSQERSFVAQVKLRIEDIEKAAAPKPKHAAGDYQEYRAA
jgi:hypothetical protein